MKNTNTNTNKIDAVVTYNDAVVTYNDAGSDVKSILEIIEVKAGFIFEQIKLTEKAKKYIYIF